MDFYSVEKLAKKLPDDGSTYLAKWMRVQRAVQGYTTCSKCDLKMRGRQSICSSCGSETVYHDGGAFPNARKVNEGKVTSPWLIPADEAEEWLQCQSE